MERMNQSKIEVGELFTIVDLRNCHIPTIAVGFVRFRIPGEVSLMPAEVFKTEDEKDFQRVFLKEAKRRKFQTFEMCTRMTVNPPEYANTVYPNAKGLYLFVRKTGLGEEVLSGILDGCRNGIIVPASVPSLNDLVKLNR